MRVPHVDKVPLLVTGLAMAIGWETRSIATAVEVFCVVMLIRALGLGILRWMDAP